ncbi:MAG: prepilin-type N-terminal cleavage/methylation domain-containing protein [Comamonadaceae bacterium]|nr:MAG: prepilin-type N-terminal cleavage/methylation domain-containing protein [Comamonadaceae bacterium]
MASRQTQRRIRPQSVRVRGFTIVELAVVLVIIGVILGAVMIGRDAQRNAEYLRIRQTFINQWAVAYNSYVQRMGVPVGDNPSAPRLMVNGATYTGTSGGDLTGVTPPDAVCQGAAGPNMVRSAKPAVSLRTLMLQAGIELPQGRGAGMEDRYTYLDTNGNPQELQVCFQWNPPGTHSGSGNVMVITGLIPDLARSLATGIKGNADASSGSFRQLGVANGAGGAVQDWTANNTQAMGAGAAAGTAAGSAVIDREAQVATVVAHYKMNQ